MGIFKNLTQEERARFAEKKAQVDSVFLANDAIVIFESIEREFDVSEISQTDNFKKLMLSYINFIWENDLTDDQKSYYYQNLGVLVTTSEEKKNYFDNLISLASEDIVKRFSNYIGKYKDVKKVIVKY